MLYIYYMYILRHEVTAYFNNVQDFSRFCEKKVKDKASSGARCLKSSIKCVIIYSEAALTAFAGRLPMSA